MVLHQRGWRSFQVRWLALSAASCESTVLTQMEKTEAEVGRVIGLFGV